MTKEDFMILSIYSYLKIMINTKKGNMLVRRQRILVVVAHPDDEALDVAELSQAQQ